MVVVVTVYLLLVLLFCFVIIIIVIIITIIITIIIFIIINYLFLFLTAVTNYSSDTNGNCYPLYCCALFMNCNSICLSINVCLPAQTNTLLIYSILQCLSVIGNFLPVSCVCVCGESIASCRIVFPLLLVGHYLLSVQFYSLPWFLAVE